MTITKHDIFVSYAQMDNQPKAGEKEGWVTKLINRLRTLLTHQLGGIYAYSLWMDDGLRHDVRLPPPEITEQLANANLLLLILSSNYLTSPACCWELGAFLAKVGPQSRRVFIVEYNLVPPEDRECDSSRHFWRFWQATETQYYQQLETLGRELAQQIRALKGQETVVIKRQFDHTTVFLAEVHDDLYFHRNQVKNYLEQHGVQILPQTPYTFSTEAELQQVLGADLQKSAVLVQLLSAATTPPTGRTILNTQYELAQSLHLPILQWRDRSLELNTVENLALRDFLGASTVLATSLEEFKEHLIQQLEALERTKAPEKPSLSTALRGLTTMFVNTTREDQEIAIPVCELLAKEYGIICTWPLEKGAPEDLREDLENNLRDSDAILMVYGKSPNTWIRRQLAQACKIVGQRRPKPVVMVCEAPPEPKQPLNMVMPPFVSVLKCGNLPDYFLRNLTSGL